MMACHKTKEDRPKPCAGYVAQVGMERIGLRLLSTKGLLNLDVYAPGAANPHETSGALLRAKGIDTEEINTVLSKTERQGHGTPKAQSASLEEEIARRTAPVEALLPKAPRLLILKTMLRAGGTCEFRYQ
ncbi:DUF6283 domain-containing protein [Acanthopleuribacter pedis]|uniref:Uncharacterized protein n=2 Tax=Acanthopleuribacter pedis TaxID=442870 RepID=A0A8J7Q7C4_9BACT|nr:hypothetical protein [Acanthopleuribacter pedis]MBO1318669.1 hypothetical protein [Acanthopleuribacter pedis]